MEDCLHLRYFSSNYTSNHLLKIEIRMTMAPYLKTWALVQGGSIVQFQGTFPDKRSYV